MQTAARPHSQSRTLTHSQSRTLGIAPPPAPRKQEGLTFSARHKTLFFVVAAINKGMTGDVKYNHAGEHPYEVPFTCLRLAHRWCAVPTAALVRSGPHVLCVFLYCLLLLCPLLPMQPLQTFWLPERPPPQAPLTWCCPRTCVAACLQWTSTMRGAGTRPR